jgi:transcriptional regulator with XRE-family HTH domain
MRYETQMKIAANLKCLRNSRSISQAEIASYLKMDRSLFALYESGRRTPDAELLLQLSLYFGVPMELLLVAEPDRLLDESACPHAHSELEMQLLVAFRMLTAFSQGRLLERAESLAEWDSLLREQKRALQEKLSAKTL